MSFFVKCLPFNRVRLFCIIFYYSLFINLPLFFVSGTHPLDLLGRHRLNNTIKCRLRGFGRGNAAIPGVTQQQLRRILSKTNSVTSSSALKTCSALSCCLIILDLSAEVSGCGHIRVIHAICTRWCVSPKTLRSCALLLTNCCFYTANKSSLLEYTVLPCICSDLKTTV